MACVEGTILREDGVGIGIGLIVERRQQVAVRLGVDRVDGQGAAVRGDGLVEKAGIEQHQPQVIVRAMIVRLERQGVPVGGHRRPELPLNLERGT